jgi:hypothetical protein
MRTRLDTYDTAECWVNDKRSPLHDRRPDTATEWLDEHGALVILAEPFCTVRILASEVALTPENEHLAGPRNTASVITLVEAFGKRILICGDATQATERFLLARYGTTLLSTPVDILRCSHHGSDEDCNIADFAAMLQAKEVIVSAGMNTQPTHGLPAVEVVKRYWEEADSGNDEHNVWYWYKHSDTDATRVNDNLYATTLVEIVPNRDVYKKKKVWTTGSNGSLMRSFAHAP